MLKVSTSCLSKDGDNIITKYLYFAIDSMNLAKYFTGATIPHIYFKDYKNESLPTASINEEHTQYVVDGKTALKYLGLVVKELGALCDEKSIPQIIKDSDRIYISERGNSFFFTYGLRRTELIVDSRGCWKRKSFYW